MDRIKAGFAQDIITPVPSEVFMDGYGFRVSPAEGVSDDIYVKACALKHGDSRFALVSLDICGLRADIADIITGHIAAIAGVSPHETALCATHTHASLACGLLADLPVNYLVWHRIGILAGQAVKRAFDNAAGGRFVVNAGEDLRFIANRRNSNGLCDRRVKTMGFYDNSGSLQGVIASASCHPVIHTDMRLSADYVGVLTRNAAARYPGIPFLFLQGRCADINPSVKNNQGINNIDEASELLGGELSNSVFGALEKIDLRENNGGGVLISSRYKKFNVPMLDYPGEATLEEAVKALREKLYAAQSPVDHRVILREMLWRENALKQVLAGKKSNEITVPLQIMALSNTAAFVFIPFELFTRTGDTIEKMLVDSGYAPASVMVIGYANGTYGYLAPREELADGGYEIIEAAHWYGLPQCGDKSEDAVLSGIAELLKNA